MNWVTKTLGCVCDLQNGFAFKSKDYVDSSNTLNIRMSNIRPDGSFNPEHNIRYLPDSYFEVYSGFSLEDGDLVIAMTDMAGDPKILGLPTLVRRLHGRGFLMNQRVGKLFDFTDDIDVPYLCHYLASPEVKSYYKKKGAGGLQINISKKDVLSVAIPLPSVTEQKRIVAILDQAFAEIDRARALTEKNLKNARELFDSTLQQVFSQRGEGWVEYEMSEVCEITSKLVDPRESEYLDLPHIGAGNIISNTGELIDVKTSREENLISGKFVFDDSMVLYSKIRPYLMKVTRPNIVGLCSADIYPLTPRNQKIDKDYLFYLLLSKNFTDYAIAGSGRAGMPKVNRTHLFKYVVTLPNIEIQQGMVSRLDEISEYSQSLQSILSKKLDKLDALKKSLLQKAFSGQLTAKDAA